MSEILFHYECGRIPSYHFGIWYILAHIWYLVYWPIYTYTCILAYTGPYIRILAEFVCPRADRSSLGVCPVATLEANMSINSSLMLLFKGSWRNGSLRMWASKGSVFSLFAVCWDISAGWKTPLVFVYSVRGWCDMMSCLLVKRLTTAAWWTSVVPLGQ